MNFGRAFTYVFDDPDWLKKIAIAGLILLIPIIGQLTVMGWGLRVARRVIEGGDDRVLPDLDFGDDLALGFKVLVVGLVWAIPIFILSIPQTILSTIISNNSSEGAVTMLALFSVCFGIVIFIYSLFLAFTLPAAIGHVVAKGNVGAGLRFGEVFGIVRRNPGAYLVVLGGIIVAGFVASLGTIACIIGVIFTIAYQMFVTGHLYGQAYRVATGGTNVISPVVPPSTPSGPLPGGY